MGAVSSHPEDSAAVLLRDQERFCVNTLTVTGQRGRALLRVSPNAYPADRYLATRELGDDTPVDYVQTSASIQNDGGPPFVLRFSNEDELTFTFNCSIRQQSAPRRSSMSHVPSTAYPIDSHISGLTFIFAPNAREVDNLVTREFHADPNIHKNPNFQLVGDFSTAGAAVAQVQWSWKWKPPKLAEDTGGGWHTACSFVEYDQRAHKLNTLASWSFWVQNTSRQQYSPQQSLSPRLDTLSPPRLRVPSAQSVESRLSTISDSDGIEPIFNVPSQSPVLESDPDASALGLIPSYTGPLEKLDVSCIGRPGEDMSATEDGPVFRATMKSLEAKTNNFRSRMKKVLKTAEAAEAAHAACNDAVAAFTDALRDASSSHANAVRPALEHYFEKIAKEIHNYEKQNVVDLRKLIIDPITRLYNVDIKQADNKRRDFEEESKDYYSYVGKYLGQRTESLKEKKRVESDSKYINKRRTFELKRFDYSSFMHDLHGGRKDQEVLSQLTRYANAQANGYMNTARKVEAMLPQLEALCTEVTQADKDFQLQRTEREEKRRALEKNPRASVVESDSGEGESVMPSLQHTGTGTTIGDTSTAPSRSTSNKFKGFRDLEDRAAPSANAAYRKEGLLWSLSRPAGHIDPKAPLKPSWHKFWIVLDQGRLSEYVNWKDKLDLHMEPIDLRMASVREARSSERRFCFEVITPHYTRVYQAPSEEDMKSWISAMNNALQSAFEIKAQPGTGPAEAQPHSTRKDIAAVLTGKSSSFSGHRLSHHSSTHGHHSSKAVFRHATTGDRPSHHRSESADLGSFEILAKVRAADQGNQICADCNSDVKVEWVSINLGVILCIECSGIHRSLGTHVSKVRSLTLDNAVFTPDLVDVLLLVGNRVSNAIWEARLDPSVKVTPYSTREQRLHFIQSKYSQHAYVEPTPQYADEALLTSIKRNDIKGVVHALAAKANPNALDKSRQTHAVFLALAAADPAMPGARANSSFSARGNSTINLTPGTLAAIPQSPSSPSRTSAETIRPTTPTGPQQDKKRFPIAELLLQNGADIPTQPAPIPLTAAALAYLDFKNEQRTGTRYASSPTAPTGSAAGGGGGGGHSPLPVYNQSNPGGLSPNVPVGPHVRAALSPASPAGRPEGLLDPAGLFLPIRDPYASASPGRGVGSSRPD